MYFAVKHSHMTLALISVVLFYFRFVRQQLLGKELAKWLKIVPHVIDTLLLTTAAILCVLLQQYPFAVEWLTYKVVFVVGYIVLAMFAMKATDKKQAITYLSFASICLVFAAKLAVTKVAF